MPVCPKCKETFRTRKNNACPGCREPVEIYKGRWYRTSDGNPGLHIVEHYEKRISDKISYNRPVRVNFVIPRTGQRWMREMVVVERFLETADGDLDLVIDAINLLFDDRMFNFKNRNSFMGIERDFCQALAIAEANKRAKLLAFNKENQAIQKVMQKEDVWS